MQTKSTILLNKTPEDKSNEWQTTPTQSDIPIISMTSNTAWGDSLQYKSPHGHVHVVSKNVGTLNTHSLDMIVITTSLQRWMQAYSLPKKPTLLRTHLHCTPAPLNAIKSTTKKWWHLPVKKKVMECINLVECRP